ncbi:MAG: hypothetical protein JWN46_3963 [Acidimicrobiales bacterium]|nr:hypothetical protein [Acidimicrobiales bacterium]
MRRSVVVVVSMVVLAALVACSSGHGAASPPPAATIGSTVITTDQLNADLAAEAAAAKKAKTAPDPRNPLTSPAGKQPGTYTPAATAAALTNRVVAEVYAQELALHHVQVTDADRTQARRTLCADTAGNVPKAPACPPLDVYPAAYRTFTLTLEERQLASTRSLYGRAYTALKAKAPERLQVVCADVVPVSDAATSLQVIAAVKAGKTVDEASATPRKAGKAQAVQSGCVFSVLAPPGLVAAKIGDVVAVTTAGGRYVAKPLKHKTATPLEFATQPPTDDPTVRAAVEAEITDLLRTVKVSVPTRYGRWDAKTFSVVAPGVAAPTTTSAPSATTTGPTTTTTTTTTARQPG